MATAVSSLADVPFKLLIPSVIEFLVCTAEYFQRVTDQPDSSRQKISSASDLRVVGVGGSAQVILDSVEGCSNLDPPK